MQAIALINMSRQPNQWFVPGEGIARDVITANIQLYFPGLDAVVRPGSGTGEYEGLTGYWTTLPRALTSQEIEELKMDSQRWQREKNESRREGGIEVGKCYDVQFLQL